MTPLRAERKSVLRLVATVLALTTPGLAQSGAVRVDSLCRHTSAKAMFYDPADLAVGGSEAPLAEPFGLRRILRPPTFPADGHVGIHYWFEDRAGRILDEAQAAMSRGSLTLHVRGNADASLEVRSVDGAGAELTPRDDGRWPGHRLARDTFVVPVPLQFRPDAGAARLVVLFARSQTELAGSADGARRRLAALTSRRGYDGAPQIVQESDGGTAGEIGTYVINRKGGPVAAEIVLRAPGVAEEPHPPTRTGR